MNIPTREKSFKYKDRTYTVNYPNTGQFIDIALFKANFTKDAYSGLSMSGANDDIYARFLVDMTAFFNICCSDLVKDLTVKISDLSIPDSKVLMNIYLKEILPWLQEWSKFINEPIADE